MTTPWRLIDSGRCDAAWNMALDEALSLEVRNGLSPSTLRLYGWDRPSLSIGCFQKTGDINVGACKSRHIPIVRRPTGGRAILHEEELTYSLSARTDEEPFCRGLLDSYQRIGRAFSLAFARAGISVTVKERRARGRELTKSSLCFQSSSYAEILIDGKKAVGSAQKRWTDGFLQQGSIPFMRVGTLLEEIVGAHEAGLLRLSMAVLSDSAPGLDQEGFKDIVVSAFEETFGVTFLRASPSEEEARLALDLSRRKYLLDSWNLRS